MDKSRKEPYISKITSNKRIQLSSSLTEETLSRSGLLANQNRIAQSKIAPELTVVKIGGHGIMDYGADVILPLVDEIRALATKSQMLLMTGGGVRTRHVLDIGLNLGMPTGVLASLSGKISEQNAIMLSVLLADIGGEVISNTDLLDVPSLLRSGILPIVPGTPPFGLYELPPKNGVLPQYRTDSGAVLAAEVLGAKSCILVKNCAGLFDKNPAIYDDATLISEITASELLEQNMDDMVLEFEAVEILSRARNLKSIQIVNGHVQGELTRVMNGGKACTTITR